MPHVSSILCARGHLPCTIIKNASATLLPWVTQSLIIICINSATHCPAALSSCTLWTISSVLICRCNFKMSLQIWVLEYVFCCNSSRFSVTSSMLRYITNACFHSLTRCVCSDKFSLPLFVSLKTYKKRSSSSKKEHQNGSSLSTNGHANGTPSTEHKKLRVDWHLRNLILNVAC